MKRKIKKEEEIHNTFKIKKVKREFDKDFPITFCPICGSDDIQCSGKTDKEEIWEGQCNQCGWCYNIRIIEKDKSNFKFRLDSKDCEICRKEAEEIARDSNSNEIEVIVDDL